MPLLPISSNSIMNPINSARIIVRLRICNSSNNVCIFHRSFLINFLFIFELFHLKKKEKEIERIYVAESRERITRYIFFVLREEMRETTKGVPIEKRVIDSGN